MENIVEALRMAAGVLFAVLLVSIIIYVFTAINSVEDVRQEQILIEQTTEFNNRFLAYDKTKMYGTDVMSIISLAINNNRDINGSVYKHPNGTYNPDLEGSINVRIHLKTDIQTKVYKVITDHTIDPEKAPEYVYDPDSVHPLFDPRLGLNKNNLDLSNEEAVKIFQAMITEGNTSKVINRKLTNHGLYEELTIEDKIGINDFKKCIFKCDEIKYTDTGKIYEMTFTEI